MASPSTLPRAIADRAAPVSLMLIGGYGVALIAMLALSHGGVDAAGRPIGTDFANVWAAGRLVLDGAPEAAYDLTRHYAVQQARFGADAPFYGWHYPPMFLGLAALLGALPYLAALALWQAATLPLYLAAIRAILPGRTALLAALAFPAVFVNLTHGHNGFLTAGLFGLGLVILDRRPVLAGVLLGLLCYKPQFGVLLPFVLVFTGRWRAAFAAAGTVIGLCLLSLAAFGPETWDAFRASAVFTREVVLEQGNTGWEKIVSAFSAARALGAGLPAAYGAQGATTLAVIALTVRLWRSDASYERKAAALLAGALLATPYALDYDMMLLGPAIAFLVADGVKAGWRPGAAAILLFAYLTPLFGRAAAMATLIPFGFLAILALFALAVAGRQPARAPVREFAHVQH
ncbi:hypothetical protein GCM10008171_11250 [Methylopila jiangsuensis]|uniref:DUF2029 domain-containing protein n=1 Tax=Methylopila jiangsuensis TaxID=586230 RepID=A0A9W6JE25_9HYPH|nr:glycosyltransferase family 87 protein [Methylopila jiangsuensis]MDR6286111.1 hypothetical protein [Methylopila jiangsuensis]GLK75871.1 hypothetical protein GCM10008171_11250 [Methylopila jiangsuensis]